MAELNLTKGHVLTGLISARANAKAGRNVVRQGANVPWWAVNGDQQTDSM